MTDAERRARRDIVRRHHPDVGGSAETLIAALAAFDRHPHRPTIRIGRTWRGRFAAFFARRRRIRRQRTSYPTKAE